MARIKITAQSPFFSLEHIAETDEEAQLVAEYIKMRHDQDVLLIAEQSPARLTTDIPSTPDRRNTPDNLIARKLFPIIEKARAKFWEKMQKAKSGSPLGLIPPEAIILSVNFEKLQSNAIQ